jgi:hypothetical protein
MIFSPRPRKIWMTLEIRKGSGVLNLLVVEISLREAPSTAFKKISISWRRNSKIWA